MKNNFHPFQGVQDFVKESFEKLEWVIGDPNIKRFLKRLKYEIIEEEQLFHLYDTDPDSIDEIISTSAVSFWKQFGPTLNNHKLLTDE